MSLKNLERTVAYLQQKEYSASKPNPALRKGIAYLENRIDTKMAKKIRRFHSEEKIAAFADRHRHTLPNGEQTVFFHSRESMEILEQTYANYRLPSAYITVGSIFAVAIAALAQNMELFFTAAPLFFGGSLMQVYDSAKEDKWRHMKEAYDKLQKAGEIGSPEAKI